MKHNKSVTFIKEICKNPNAPTCFFSLHFARKRVFPTITPNPRYKECCRFSTLNSKELVLTY